MASPNETFTELVTTTFRKHGRTFIDNVSKNNAFYKEVAEKDQVEEESGGLSLVEPLDYGSNSTYQRYSGYDPLNINPSEVLTSAEFPWRQIAIHVTASGYELRVNSGDSAILKLAKARIKNAMRTFRNNFSLDLYSDGSLPNQINGLQALVADTGVGVVGGINSTTWPFWRNIVQSAAAPLQGGAAVTVSATTIENGIMLHLYLALSRGDDQPDLIISSNDWFAYFEASQTSLKRYADSNSARGGFLTLYYKRAKVIFDGGSGIPDSHMYFLNTDYYKVRVHRDANLETLDEVKPLQQDASVTPIIWMGNVTLSNRALQGVAKA